MPIYGTDLPEPPPSSRIDRWLRAGLVEAPGVIYDNTVRPHVANLRRAPGAIAGALKATGRYLTEDDRGDLPRRAPAGTKEKAAGAAGQAKAIAEHERASAIKSHLATADVMRRARGLEVNRGVTSQAMREAPPRDLGRARTKASPTELRGLRARAFQRPPDPEPVDEYGWDRTNRAAAGRLDAQVGTRPGIRESIALALPGSAAQERIDDRVRRRIRGRYEDEVAGIEAEAERNDPMRRSIAARAAELQYERMLPAGSESTLQFSEGGPMRNADQMNDWNRDGRGELGGMTIGEEASMGAALARQRAEVQGKERVATAPTRQRFQIADQIERDYEYAVKLIDGSALPADEKVRRLAQAKRERHSKLGAVGVRLDDPIEVPEEGD